MNVGTFGKIIFQTSSEKAMTFGKLSEKAGAKYADISLLRGKPRKQFIGAALQTVSLDIVVRADLGYKPREIIAQLKKWRRAEPRSGLLSAGIRFRSSQW